MYIHLIFFLFKVKELPGDEQFSFLDSVSYFSNCFIVWRQIQNILNRTRVSRTGTIQSESLSNIWTIQSGDILENRDNRFERDFREPGQSSLTRFSRSGTIQSDEIFEIRDNPGWRDFRDPEKCKMQTKYNALTKIKQRSKRYTTHEMVSFPWTIYDTHCVQCYNHF